MTLHRRRKGWWASEAERCCEEAALQGKTCSKVIRVSHRLLQAAPRPLWLWAPVWSLLRCGCYTCCWWQCCLPGGGRARGLLRPCSVCRVATFCRPSSLSCSYSGFHTVSHLRRWRNHLMRRASRSAAPATQLWSRGCGAYRTGPTRSPSPPKRWSLQPRKSPRGLWALTGRLSL